MTKPDLDARIADAFAAPQSSGLLSDLLDEVGQAAAKALDGYAQAKQIALDPATRPDAVAKARREMGDAEFSSSRLANAAAKLKEILTAAKARELNDRKRVEFAAAKAERDELASDLASQYPGLCDQLASLMKRLVANNERIAIANHGGGHGEWLADAETLARKAPDNWATNHDSTFPRLTTSVRLPAFYKGDGDGTGLAYPTSRF